MFDKRKYNLITFPEIKKLCNEGSSWFVKPSPKIDWNKREKAISEIDKLRNQMIDVQVLNLDLCNSRIYKKANNVKVKSNSTNKKVQQETVSVP